MPGFFICFEGANAVGKTTQCELLQKKLHALGIEFLLTKATGSETRKAITDFFNAVGMSEPKGIESHDVPITFFYQSLHALHYQRVEKLLKSGCNVISDRWKATYDVYKKNYGPLAKPGNELAHKVIGELTFGDLEPDLTIILDQKPEDSIRACVKRHRDSMSPPSLLFQTTIRNGYLHYASGHKNWFIIDTTDKSIDEVHQMIWEVVMQNMLVRNIGSIEVESSLHRIHMFNMLSKLFHPSIANPILIQSSKRLQKRSTYIFTAKHKNKLYEFEYSPEKWLRFNSIYFPSKQYSFSILMKNSALFSRLYDRSCMFEYAPAKWLHINQTFLPLKPGITSLLIKNSGFFSKLYNRHLEEYRHIDSRIQYEYDEHFGLAEYKPLSFRKT